MLLQNICKAGNQQTPVFGGRRKENECASHIEDYARRLPAPCALDRPVKERNASPEGLGCNQSTDNCRRTHLAKSNQSHISHSRPSRFQGTKNQGEFRRGPRVRSIRNASRRQSWLYWCGSTQTFDSESSPRYTWKYPPSSWTDRAHSTGQYYDSHPPVF